MSESRLPEWIKNLLILLLSLSALWLVSLSPLYVGSPLESWVRQLFPSESLTSQASVSRTTAAAQPLAVSFSNADGRYTARYDSETVADAFDAVTPLFGAALAAPGTPFPIAESRWQQALSQTGVYLEFDCALPFSVLAGWLNGSEPSASTDAAARRFLLAPGNLDGEVWLFWQDAHSLLFFACGTSLSVDTHLTAYTDGRMPNFSFFAFEDDAYAACAPYTLITDPPRPAVYTAAVSLSAANPSAVEQVLSVFSYSPTSGSSYAISDGTRYTDGVTTFQLTDSGILTYHAPHSETLSVSTSHEVPTLTECIETTRALLQNTLGLFCGSAQLSLSAVEQEDSSLILTYEYFLDGIPVALRQDGWAAQFVVEDGSIAAFTLHFRSYTPTGETALLLPELQAAATLSPLDAEGCELVLYHLDAGSASARAAWLAR